MTNHQLPGTHNADWDVSPTVHKQLLESLTSEEIAHLLNCGLVCERQGLTPEDLDYLKKVIRDSIRMERVKKLREIKDRERLDWLHLSRLQDRLFRCLETEPDEGLSELNAIGIVYGSAWREDQLPRLKLRLRVLQKALNDKLNRAGSSLRVIRPESGVLRLHDPEAAEEGECAETPCDPEREAQLRRLLHELHALADPPPPRPRLSRVKKCMDFIQTYLGSGTKATTALDEYCRAKGCRPGTIRTAKRKLEVRSERTGYGASGQWNVRLPSPAT